jgi:MFS family permease
MLILMSALALHNGLRIGPVPLVDELRARYGVDYTGVGNVIGAYTLAYAFAQLTAGLLTDRFGPKRLLLVGLTLAAVGSALFAVPAYPVAVAARLSWGRPAASSTPRSRLHLRAFDPRSAGEPWVAEAGVGRQILAVLLLPVAFTTLGLVRRSSLPGGRDPRLAVALGCARSTRSGGRGAGTSWHWPATATSGSC